MNESSKSIKLPHRKALLDKYLVGIGLDIGSGPDPLQWPMVGRIDTWDLENGDAQYLCEVKPDTYDFIWSSHCIEHLQDVTVAIGRWSRVVKPGGALFITAPCWKFYEHERWPSQFNPDHKQRFSFCPMPDTSPMGNCHSLGNMLRIGEASGLRLVEAWLELDGYDWALKASRSLLADQTQLGACAQICYVFEKPKRNDEQVRHGLYIGGLPSCPRCHQPLADGEKKCLACG